MENFNIIMNNPENMYYGHGTGTDEPERLTSILTHGLRCSHGSLYFTTCTLGMGNNIEESEAKMLKKWPHNASNKIVIVSLPNKFNILDSFSMGTYQKANSAFYYTPDEKQRRTYGLSDGYYVMPEFILGYYDAVTDEFYRNQIYYELLPEVAQKELFDTVKRNYVKILEDGCGIVKYKETLKELPGWTFPLTDDEVIKYTGKSSYNSELQVEMATLQTGIISLNEKRLDIQTLIDSLNPLLLEKMMRLPNGVQISARQYIQEIVFPHLPKDGIVIMSNGVRIPVKQFIEEYVMFECQEKYNGDFSRYIMENTRANEGIVYVESQGKINQVKCEDIVKYINPELLDKGIRLPSGTVITVKQFIQDFYVPHIPADGRIILTNGMGINVIQYIEGVLLGDALFRYNGDISQILYNTTRRNVGVIQLVQSNNFSQLQDESIVGKIR